jgi:hypothetical protein
MARLPDEDLFAIASANEDEGYRHEAIEAAQAELASRNLDVDTLDRVQTRLDQERQHQETKSDIPLSNGGWVVFVISGVFVFWPLVAAYVLNHRGYRRKSKEALWAIPLSIALWWAVGAALLFFFD